MSKLIEFQQENGLVPDGKVGRNTLLKMQQVFNIISKERISHFAGQLAHETNNFKSTVESFNYSSDGLMKTFSYYKKNPDLAILHGRGQGKPAEQQAIANTVYDDKNRAEGYKLGNICPGDGWKFRGRGSIMITGRNNYEAFFDWALLPKDTNPELVVLKYYWATALWFFEKNYLWNLCHSVSDFYIERLTKRINGGLNGIDHRKALTYRYYRALN